jgi:hypothetical protein
MASSSQGWHGASIGAWISTFVILAGTVVGGIGLIETFLGPIFWIGVGLFIAGWIGGYFSNIMGATADH